MEGEVGGVEGGGGGVGEEQVGGGQGAHRIAPIPDGCTINYL